MDKLISPKFKTEIATVLKNIVDYVWYRLYDMPTLYVHFSLNPLRMPKTPTNFNTLFYFNLNDNFSNP